MKAVSILLAGAAALAAGLASPQPATPPKGAPVTGQGHGRMYGWSLMSPQERSDHQQKMRSFDDYHACTAYVAEHHELMQARAKEKGGAARRPLCVSQALRRRTNEGRMSIPVV